MNKYYIGIYNVHKMEFYSSIRNNDTLWFEGEWMQLEDIMLSEIRQSQKDKGHMFSLTCGR
jgi:hypothetical protein